MEGLKVKCTTCGGVLHETTDKYDPNKILNGSMVRLIDPWKSWGWSAFDDETANISTTPSVLMCCPNCSAPLVKNGRLTIVKDIKSRVAMNQEAMNGFEDIIVAEPEKPKTQAELNQEKIDVIVTAEAFMGSVRDLYVGQTVVYSPEFVEREAMDGTNQEAKKFKCPYCPKSFDIKIALIGHMRSHKEKK